jgi:hypothetical protein
MMTTLGTSADGQALPGCRLRRVTEYIQQNLDKDACSAAITDSCGNPSSAAPR